MKLPPPSADLSVDGSSVAPSTDLYMQARSDARSLSRAGQVIASPARMRNAHVHMAKQLSNTQATMSAMPAIKGIKVPSLKLK